jgi:hypothetical protein
MNIALKYIIALLMIPIAMGVLAGLLVRTFDFSPHRTSLQIILAVVIIIDFVLMYVAYKKGRLGLKETS